ncbi:fluoride efflux transporter CrcB [Niveibacterium umoris]|uniref:Fluoride-specific ion channel FluC n=1 Tax=Niveibacterium umoris TaxID=1193620 RepID=A0A840BHC5_9RHOO|nr:fluoride efflux transporter CrcB [Niveibacterium umoris]MBB4012625.1 CrcB protein [Niveibacterium umoris]
MFANLIAVGGGAALGAWARWGLGMLLNPLFAGFPLGTLAANLIGGFLMGLALALIQFVPELPVALRLLATTGFLGGLTTFSSFSGEVFQLFERQAVGMALVAIATHVGGSLLMTWAGWSLFQALRG